MLSRTALQRLYWLYNDPAVPLSRCLLSRPGLHSRYGPRVIVSENYHDILMNQTDCQAYTYSLPPRGRVSTLTEKLNLNHKYISLAKGLSGTNRFEGFSFWLQDHLQKSSMLHRFIGLGVLFWGHLSLRNHLSQHPWLFKFSICSDLKLPNINHCFCRSSLKID